MILVDSGPLVAVLNRNDLHHGRCVAALASLSGPLQTTWPVLTEAMYMLGSRIGWEAQESLWTLIIRGDLLLDSLEGEGPGKMRAAMHKYRDVPMDLADASLVVLAEKIRQRRIFTLDGDFRIYRLPGKKSFTLVP